MPTNDIPICPFMSCRVTSIVNQGKIAEQKTKSEAPDLPIIVPTAIKCEQERCAIWDSEYKCCSILSLKGEMVKIQEALQDQTPTVTGVKGMFDQQDDPRGQVK